MNILIVGGAGFIGSNLLAWLHENNHFNTSPIDVTLCDHFLTSPANDVGGSIKWKNLRTHIPNLLIDPSQLTDYLENHGESVDVVINLADIESRRGPLTRKGWDEGYQNIKGGREVGLDQMIATHYHLPRWLWQWCSDHGKKFIFGSTSTTYGDGTQGFAEPYDVNDIERLKPLSPWAWSHHLFDVFAMRQASVGRCPPYWYGLKMFHAYGPNEYHRGLGRSLVSYYAEKAKAHDAIPIPRSYRQDVRDGEQKRDFIWIDDVLSILWFLMENPCTSGILNVGSGNASSINAVIKALEKTIGTPFKTEIQSISQEARLMHPYHEKAVIKGLRARGYSQPMTSLEDGIAHFVGRYVLGKSVFR